MQELRNEFCETKTDEIPDLSQLNLKMDDLPQMCVDHVEKSFEHFVDIHQNVKHKIFEADTAIYFMKSANNLMLSTGVLCRGLKLIELQRKPLSFLMLEKTAHEIARQTELMSMKYFLTLREDYLKTENGGKRRIVLSLKTEFFVSF